MLKNGTKRILLVIVILMGILVICTNNAYAINIAPSNNTLNQTTNENNIQQINGIGVLNNTTNTTTNTVNNTTTTPIVSNNTQNANISTYTNSDLPETGVEDYPIMILITVCIIAAIYAYIKVKNYNNL